MTTYSDAVTALNALLYTGGRGRITPENMATAIVDVTDALQSSLDEHADIIPVADLIEAAALTGLHAGDIIHVANNGASKWARYQVTSAGDGTWSGASKTLFLTQDQAHTHLVADLSDASAAARTLLQQVDAAAMRTALGLSTLATGALPGAAGLLAGEEGVAFDFLTRTAYVNDYANDLTDSGRPSDLLTVSRASTKMVVGRDRLLASVAANKLAYRHNPVTGAPQGIMVEGATTNLELRSQEFDNATWTKMRASVSANAVTAPDGTATADKLVEDTTNGIHQVWQGEVAFTAGTTYTYSVFLKAAERQIVAIGLGTVFSGVAYFNLATGTVETVTGGNSASIVPHANGWYRCSVTATAASSATAAGFDLRPSATGADLGSYLGDGASGFYAWGVQLESGSYASSYIPTTTTTVTRNADAISIATSLFPLNASQGALFIEAEMLMTLGSGGTVFGSLCLRADGSNFIAAGRMVIPALPTAPYVDGYILSGGATQSDTTNVAASGVMRCALAYRQDDINHVVNGSSSTDTSAAIPTSLTALHIGVTPGATASSGALLIRRVAYFSRRLTDAELIRMTS